MVLSGHHTRLEQRGLGKDAVRRASAWSLPCAVSQSRAICSRESQPAEAQSVALGVSPAQSALPGVGRPIGERVCGRSGVPGEIRTHGPQIRNLVLYPAELRGLMATLAL